MEKACQLIRDADKKRWHVTVFGDYDADGTPASAVLSLMLTKLGIRHDVVLPTRASGYGLRTDHIQAIAKASQLLITVDTGISSYEEVRLAKELGLRVIILDHHLPPETLPPADAVVDPHRTDSQYPFAHLCGCALAYKLVVALGKHFPVLSEGFSKWLLDLVAVSTVADMMPLVGENRALVHYGLIVLRQNRRPGLKALLDQARIEPHSLDARSLGFVIGPRLNAAGRLGDNAPAYELLVADSEERASTYAQEIEGANAKRQEIVGNIMTEAERLLFQQNKQDDRVYVLSEPNWPAGVVGLVAGKLTGKYARPVLVATIENGVVRGSARSIEAYPIVSALAEQKDLLSSYGGHAVAAGFSLTEKNWPRFVDQLKASATQKLSLDLLRHTHVVDAELQAQDFSRRSIDNLTRLEPHGLGNSRPLFLLKQAKLKNIRRIGKQSQHVKGNLVTADNELEALAFGMADDVPSLDGQIDYIGHLEVNRWNNRDSLQFQIIDYRPANDTFDWILNGQI